MNVGDLSQQQFATQLAHDGVSIRWGPFVSQLVCTLPELAEPLYRLYQNFPLAPDAIRDFHVRLARAGRSIIRTNDDVEFLVDQKSAFQPFPRRIALCMLEWGLNWCVYSSAHQYLILHAAVVEQNGHAVLLSGRPGAGKSTLCAGLVASGWRLLSDELALIDISSRNVIPVARPICLKDRSIDVIKQFAPGTIFGPTVEDTHKGTVSHMRPPNESVRRAREPAKPAIVILPQFIAEADLQLDKVSKAQAFFSLADNSFNYEVLGEIGFDTLSDLVDKCDCFRMSYANLDEGIRQINYLAAAHISYPDKDPARNAH
jgi:HprK-related kinase A